MTEDWEVRRDAGALTYALALLKGDTAAAGEAWVSISTQGPARALDTVLIALSKIVEQLPEDVGELVAGHLRVELDGLTIDQELRDLLDG